MSAVRFHDDAVAEMDAAIAWYNERRAGLGLGLLEAVREAVARIRENPQTGVSSFVEIARQCRVRRFPYAVHWIESDGVLWIIAVAHLSRRPGCWRGRLDSV